MAGILEEIYLHAPTSVKQLVLTNYGKRLHQLRYGGGDWPDYTIDVLFGKSRNQLDTWQLALFNRLLKLSVNIPFYRERFTLSSLSALTELQKIPVLTKEEIRKAGEHLCNPLIPKRLRVVGHTSGSTGSPLTFWHSLDSVRKMFSLYRSFRNWHGIDDSCRRVRFGGRLILPYNKKRPPYWLADPANKTLYLSLLHMKEETLSSYVDAIGSFDGHEFSGYPSSIYTLAVYCLRHGITLLRPHCVITDSETLLDHQRDTIRRAFACPVIDYYGISETEGIFAGECPAGNRHLLPQAAIVEILDDEGNPCAEGETGIVHVTSLSNDCMPLFRYRIGDLASVSNEYCPCGLQTRLLSNLEGRLDDTVTTADGRRIGRLDHIFKQGGDIREAQIIQIKPGIFNFRVVPGEGFSSHTLKSLEAEARQRLGADAEIRFETLASIPRTSRGKFRSVIVQDGEIEA